MNMNKEIKTPKAKKSILKFELFNDGTSTTEQDLVGLMQYLQMITAEGSKTVDVVTDIIAKIVVALNKKVAETDEAIELARSPGKLGELKDKVQELSEKLNESIKDRNDFLLKKEKLEHDNSELREEIERLKFKTK
jgi:hypothetical protein